MNAVIKEASIACKISSKGLKKTTRTKSPKPKYILMHKK